MKKIKIVIVTDSFLPRRDGVVRFLSEIIPRLQENFSIKVICPDYKEENVSLPGIEVVRIARSKRYVGDYRIAKFRPLKILKHILKADIVFGQDVALIGATGMYLAQRFRKKTVSYIHTIEWEIFPKAISEGLLRKYAYPISKRFARYLHSHCTELIVPSERTSDLLTWEGVTTPKKLIHLGVDIHRFVALEDLALRDKQRLKLGVHKGDVLLGYHGRISREKDVLTLVRAFVKLRKKHKHLKLLVLGNGIPSLINQIKKQPGVIYLPATDQVENYLPLVDIYCLPSLIETTSLTTLEAMSTQLAVVCTPVGFVKDYIIPEVNGLFFKPKDSYSLAQQLDKLIQNKHFREILGKNARKTVTEQFDWDVTATKMVQFFNEIAYKK